MCSCLIQYTVYIIPTYLLQYSFSCYISQQSQHIFFFYFSLGPGGPSVGVNKRISIEKAVLSIWRPMRRNLVLGEEQYTVIWSCGRNSTLQYGSRGGTVHCNLVRGGTVYCNLVLGRNSTSTQ